MTPLQTETQGTGLLALSHELQEEPEVTILIPTMNEELTIGRFLEWCAEGFRKAGVRGEVLIVDSSEDRTAEQARAKGARVIETPRRGLGRAYQDGIPHVRGRLVIMGDADCTYDFREIAGFVEAHRQGHEFIMGSRFRGSIEKGAMPALHRYFGTPFTTWILNVLYGSRFSDIHCGMRAMSSDALRRMDLQSDSWEYASEMVLKSVHMKLATTEVPVAFFRDQEGRLSHHKRSGWLSPWKAGWINLRVMLTHGAEFFTIRPGMIMTVFGLALTLPLTLGPVRLGPTTLSLNWMLVGLTLTISGLQTFYLGCLAQMFHDYDGSAARKWLCVFSFNRSVLASVGLLIVGFMMVTPLVLEYLHLGLTLSGHVGRNDHMAITGLLAVLMAYSNFVFTLSMHAASARPPHSAGERKA